MADTPGAEPGAAGDPPAAGLLDPPRAAADGAVDWAVEKTVDEAGTPSDPGGRPIRTAAPHSVQTLSGQSAPCPSRQGGCSKRRSSPQVEQYKGTSLGYDTDHVRMRR
ncbi:hypothetical protein [Actinomadura miaoliensis]|uniref:Transposase n=1 Tax=Actinomadura miaoliensis TaxID=430685 RepID=A0ABP7WTV4_9ACTN